MDSKTKLRMVSKIGILLVFIGFFLPVSCNQNGFQLAKALETVGGPNWLSVSLYLIFLASCAGIILFIFLLQKIPYGIKWDWLNIIFIIAPLSIVIYAQVNGSDEPIVKYFTQFQSGAYIMFGGVIVSLVALIFVSVSHFNTSFENFDPETQRRANTWVSSGSKNAEEEILALATKTPIMTVRGILLHTKLNIVEIENAIANLLSQGIVVRDSWLIGNYYLFKTANAVYLNEGLMGLLPQVGFKRTCEFYEKISDKTEEESIAYVGRLSFVEEHKLGSDEEWQKELAKYHGVTKKFRKKLLIPSVGGIIVLISQILFLNISHSKLADFFSWFGLICLIVSGLTFLILLLMEKAEKSIISDSWFEKQEEGA